MSLLTRIAQHRVSKNAGFLVLLQIVEYVAPLLVVVHLSRVLGLEVYGVVAFSIGLVQLGYVLTDFGFTLSATQKISTFRHKRRYVARLVGAILAIKVALFVLVAIVLIGYAVLTEKYAAYSPLFVLSLLPLFGMTFQPIWLFAGIERMSIIVFLGSVAKFVVVLLVYVLVRGEDDYLWVPISYGGAQISIAVLGILMIYRTSYRIAVPHLRDIRYAAKTTAAFFASRISVSIYATSGVPLLGLFASPAAVGTFALAEQLYKVMQSAFMPVNQAVYPYMAKEKDVRLLAKIAAGCVLVAIAGAVLGYLTAPYLISIVFGPAWTDVSSILNIFFIAITVHVLAVFSGYPLAVAVNRVDVANRSVIYGSAICAICVAWLIVSGSVTPSTIAILMIVTELYVLAHRGWVLWPRAFKLGRFGVIGAS